MVNLVDKRTLKRRHLIYYLRVFDRGTEKLVGHLMDVTRGGIMLISETPIKVGNIYQFRMDLPVEMWGQQHIDFETKSVWCSHDVNPNFYNTGFELVNFSGHHIEIIERLISQYGFRD